MTMSEKNLVHFLTAINCLMNDDIDDSAHYIISSRLQAFQDKYSVWLEEIPREIENTYSSNVVTKLSLLPKTPSVKNRARKRLNAVQEDESDNEPTETKQNPEKINSCESQVSAIKESPRGGPKRSCRNIAASHTSDPKTSLYTSKPQVQALSLKEPLIIVDSPKGRPKRSCRNRTTTSHNASARKVGLRTSKSNAQAPPLADKISNEDDEVETNIVETASKLKPTVTSESVAGATKAKAVTSQVGFKEDSDNQSPSVRDRARAYETMLNHKTKSPTKVVKAQTPNSATRNFASATISSLAKSSPQLACAAKLSPALSPCLSSKAAARRSKRSSRRSSRISKSCSEHPGNSKPTRSRLALHKKSSGVNQNSKMDHETVSLPTVVAKKGKNRSSLDSALSSASSMMSPKSSSCDDDQHAIEDNSEGEKDLVSKDEKEEDMDEGLDVTHTVITEVYDLSADGKEDLIDYEKIETKTVHASVQESIPDTQVSEEESSKDSSTSAMNEDGNQTVSKDSPKEVVQVARTTRTKARALQANTSVEVSVKNSPSRPSTTASYTELKSSSPIEDSTDQKDDEKEEPLPRSTRTRTRAKNQQEVESEECGVIRTRTRKRLADVSKDVSENSVRDVSVVSIPKTAPLPTAVSPELAGGMRSTRSRMRLQAGAESISCGAYDEVVAGSPAMKTANSIRSSKKRPVEEYGASPKPKRSRSCAGMAEPNSTFNAQSILLTSSPRRDYDDHEDEDTVDCSLMSSARKQHKPFTFTSAQKSSSFMKRTPAFARTNSKVYSFLGNSTPTQGNGGALSSFLKRNTPKSKATPLQVLQEQKMQKLQEKESKERERLKRAAEAKKQRLEEQKRLRDDRLRKVAEARGKKLREEMEQKERINKKFEDQATLKDKMLEEKLKAETEKKELREKKMMEANSRRRQEEEERLKKRAEMEEEAKRQQDWLQRKKEYEEEERRKHLEEEKRKQEERMQKVQEEKAKQKRLEEEKRERLRKDRERQLALERAEKERVEREKREERERRLEEQRQQEEMKRAEELRKLQEIRKAQEQEKIRMMEAAHKRAQEEVMRIEREREAKKVELQKLIDHSKQGTSHNTSTSTKEPVNSYMITPVKAKVYKPSTDPNNYDIGDKGSDESTDEEDAPKKKIPEWAMGVYLNAALIKQYKYPPDIKNIFRPHLVDAPDLTRLFPTSRHRHKFKYRTSSAIWTSPAMKK